jgi:hypothetical protein
LRACSVSAATAVTAMMTALRMLTTTTTVCIALIYPDITVTIAADGLSTPAPKTAVCVTVGVTATAYASAITARITKIAHNRISIPLVYLR